MADYIDPNVAKPSAGLGWYMSKGENPKPGHVRLPQHFCKRVRQVLINDDSDDEQVEFLLALVPMGENSVDIPLSYAQHLQEYLKGARQ